MADQAETRRVKVTNSAPGPRTIFTANGGYTLQKGESKTIPLTENDYKGIKPYVDLRHLELSEPDDDDDDEVVNNDIGGEDTSGNPVEGAKTLGVDIVPTNVDPEDDDDDFTGPDSTDGEFGDDSRESAGVIPTHIEHRGFGRWYGMAGEERITAAMTEAEAEAYAAEHTVVKKTAQDPSDETPPAEETETQTEADVETAPADETTGA